MHRRHTDPVQLQVAGVRELSPRVQRRRPGGHVEKWLFLQDRGELLPAQNRGGGSPARDGGGVPRRSRSLSVDLSGPRALPCPPSFWLWLWLWQREICCLFPCAASAWAALAPRAGSVGTLPSFLSLERVKRPPIAVGRVAGKDSRGALENPISVGHSPESLGRLRRSGLCSGLCSLSKWSSGGLWRARGRPSGQAAH